ASKSRKPSHGVARSYRYDSSDEMKVFLQELKCMMWGSALMSLVNDFVEWEWRSTV
ncbi:hypothetical protein K439DRAFT_1372064, partial [Ramaria rubella]